MKRNATDCLRVESYDSATLNCVVESRRPAPPPAETTNGDEPTTNATPLSQKANHATCSATPASGASIATGAA